MPEVARYWNEEREEWRALLASDPVLHVGPEEPTGPEDLWVDTDEDIPTGGGASSWDELEDKPTTFPPAEHAHDDRYYTEAEVDQRITDFGNDLREAPELGSDTDLNTVVDPGEYSQVTTAYASLALNYPAELAGRLWVQASSTRSQVSQMYTVFATSRPAIYSRNFYGGQWSPWLQVPLVGGGSDSGPRDLTPIAENYVSGGWTLHRVDRTVFMNLYDLRLTPTAGSYWLSGGFIPQGFRPVPTASAPYINFDCTIRNSNYSPGPLRVDRYGGVTLYGVTGMMISVSAMWITSDNPPTVQELPGDPA